MVSREHIYLLHGWAVDPSNETKWESFRTLLHERDITTTFFGLPGLTVPLDAVWKLDDYVDWVVRQLPAEPVVLLGHSFGGQIAVRLAARFPERVKALILVDSSGFRDHSVTGRTKRGIFWLLAKLGRVARIIPGARVALYKLAREHDYYQAPQKLRATMAHVIGHELHHDIPQVRARTLIIWGAADRVTPLKNAQYFKQIPHAQLVIIPEARHSPHFTHPAAVATAVISFLQGTGGKGV